MSRPVSPPAIVADLLRRIANAPDGFKAYSFERTGCSQLARLGFVHLDRGRYYLTAKGRDWASPPERPAVALPYAD